MIQVFILVTSMNGGGASRVASELSLSSNDSINYTIVTYRNDGSNYLLSNPPLSLKLNIGYNSTIVQCGLQYIIGCLRYAKLLLKLKPDLTISMLAENNILNPPLSMLFGIQSIVSVHSDPRNKMGVTKGYYILRILGILCGSIISRQIITVSKEIKNELILSPYNINPNKISVIPNPIDLKSISYLMNESVLEPFFTSICPKLIFVGRLSKVKGLWHLIRVFYAIHKKMECKLIICGDGDQKEILQQLVCSLSIQDSVLFTGWVKNPYKYISHSDIFVLPSLSESFGNVLIESMACGCPVVASYSIGPAEILGDNEYGLLCLQQEEGPINISRDELIPSEVDMMKKITLLLQDDNIYNMYQYKGLKKAKEYDTKLAVDRYSELINKCLHK